MRGLVAYFALIEVTTLPALRTWAEKSKFNDDFEGKVKGLGIAVYQWLVMRQGIETVKPDVHMRRFLMSIVNRYISDEEIITTFQKVAKELERRAYELDWAIWEMQSRFDPTKYGYDLTNSDRNGA